MSIEAIDGGNGADKLTGNTAANLLMGNAGRDVISGGSGDDTLDGGMGDDSLSGGNDGDLLIGGLGNDTMIGGAGDDLFTLGPTIRINDSYTAATFVDFGLDRYDGGAGIDTIFITDPSYYILDSDLPNSGGDRSDAPAARINLALGTLRIGESQNKSTLISIENVQTGSGSDAVNGNSQANYINVGDGANIVYAGGGNDTIIGGYSIYNPEDGAGDKLNGGAGDDVIYGWGSNISERNAYPLGTDILVGESGNDTIYGGSALQTISGGTGEDFFVLDTGKVSVDDTANYFIPDTTIVDFEHGVDVIGFNRLPSYTTFGGEIDPGIELNPYEIVYSRTTDGNTLVQMMVGFGDFPEENTIHIILADYTGPLSASDFDLA